MSGESNLRLTSVLSKFEPVKKKEIALSPDEVRYRSLLIVMANKTISYRSAVQIVGGEARLNNLMERGEIRCDKPDGSPNRKWKINAADCYRNIKPRVVQVLNNLK